ncbi:MAG: HMA2 domain-containing protein [Methylococcaceae bacterium]
MDTLIAAYIAHHIPGRLRLRIPDRRGDTVFFSHLSECLGRCAGIESITVKPQTACVVFTSHPGLALADIVEWGRDKCGLNIQQQPLTVAHPSVAEAVGSGLGGLDRGMARFSSGVIDLRSLLFIVLVILIIRQLRRGQLVGPVSSLLLSALDITGLGRH